MTVTYTLKPIDEGTKLKYGMDYDFGALERFGKGYLEKSIEKSLEKLKSVLEK